MNIIIENNLGVDLQSTILVIISTFLIILIAKKYFWNVILEYFAKRKAFLESEFQKASDIKNEAENYKSEYESQLANVKNQAEMIIDTAKSQAKDEYNQIVQNARSESNLLLEKAKVTIEFEKKQAELELNTRIKEVAFAAAEKMIKKEINESTKQAYVEEFIESVNE